MGGGISILMSLSISIGSLVSLSTEFISMELKISHANIHFKFL